MNGVDVSWRWLFDLDLRHGSSPTA
jgi:hypothetical protein